MSLIAELGRDANSWLSWAAISQLQHINGSFKTTAWRVLMCCFWNDSYSRMTRMSLGFWVTNGLLLTPGIEPLVGPCIDSLLYVLTMVLALVYSTQGQWAWFLASFTLHALLLLVPRVVTALLRLGQFSQGDCIAPLFFQGFQDHCSVMQMGTSDWCPLLPLIDMNHT